MRILTLITLLFLGGLSHASDYHLEPNKFCSSLVDGLTFSCEHIEESYKIFIYQKGTKWFKKHTWENPRSETKWELFVVKNDENILILSQDVLYSGSRLLHIMKKTNNYYQSEVAYSTGRNQVSIIYGRVFTISK